MTTIAIPLFPQFTALDGIGPYEVLQRIPDFVVTFVGRERGVVRSDNGFLGIEVDATYDELPQPDVVVFPGGIGTRALLTDERGRSTGCGAPTRRARSRRRCARARSCSPPPGSSKG